VSENLPAIKTDQNLVASKARSSTLLGRGLAAIEQQKLVLANQDNQYRQARDAYDQITDYGFRRCFDVGLIPKQMGQIDLFADETPQKLQPLIEMTQQLVGLFCQFKQLASNGYGKAYVLLSKMYMGGQGVEKNLEQSDYYSRLALEWCLARQGINDSELWNDLGWLYGYGRGVELDNEATVYWTTRAAEKGYAEAQNRLGRIFEDGLFGLDQDDFKASIWYTEAANQGHSDAQNNLGRMFQNGRGMEQDDELAVFWYTEAAEQGNVRGQNNLGYMYRTGQGIEQDDELAVFWHTEAAEQGHAMAQSNLGWMYEVGRGIEQDNKQAVFWYRQAANQGEATAQCNLGLMYQYGRGVEQDYEQALSWYRKSAEQEYARAYYRIGLMYANGDGVEQSDEESVHWYTEAAIRDHADAQF
jgi:TPR repeat protein